MLASSLAVLLGVYLAGLVRLWRSAGYGRGIRPFEAAAFAAGWLTLAIALSPPLDAWSDRWLAVHMIQHELLMVMAAPLIAASAPLIATLWAMPAVIRHRLVGAIRRTPVTRAWDAVTSPAAVFALYALALWTWHIPALYDAALAHGAAVVYVFATAIHGGLLGALMTVSPHVWYAPYLTQPPARLTPLEDQQLAGLLMWVPASLVFVAGALVLFAAWLRQSDRLSRFPSRSAWTPTGVK